MNYDEWHASLEVDFDVNTPWHQFFKLNEKKFNFQNMKILEIGCGRGGFANYFMEKYGDVLKSYTAIDYSEEAVRKANSYFVGDRKKITFDVGDIQCINSNQNEYDFVFSFETIEHVPHPQLAIKELYRVLKPTGVLILTTPNYLNFIGLYRFYLRLTGRKWTELGQPINRFVLIPRTLFWLKIAGFDLINFSSSIFFIPWFNKKIYNFHFKLNFINKYFGLQSYFIIRKRTKN